MTTIPVAEFYGLTDKEVIKSRQEHGRNSEPGKENKVFITILKQIVLQPMFVLLLAACLLYFFAGQYTDAVIMLIAILIVSGISLFQEYRSQNAIDALRKLSAPESRVIRNGQLVSISPGDMVVGDVAMIEEGEIISADGELISSHDLSINESLLTGESLPVSKSSQNSDKVYKATQVTGGKAVMKVTEVGNKTMFGRIGLSLQEIKVLHTPLQKQIHLFVNRMIWIGSAAFVFVVIYHLLKTGDVRESFLQGLTLAMSVLPEEIPVAFTTFQALGAFRLLRNGIIVKQPQYVETLGSATVICVDKTGTLTENKMEIQFLYDALQHKQLSIQGKEPLPSELIEYAMWSSETDPFDMMERSIHDLYSKVTKKDKRKDYIQIHEYPVAGKPPMMTHVFSGGDKEIIIAMKGAPEALLRQSELTPSDEQKIYSQLEAYASQGYRVLGVGRGIWEEKTWPISQEEFRVHFLGLIAFRDPPKTGIAATIGAFRKAGISVKMITGDHPGTSLSIAKEIGLKDGEKWMSGKDVIQCSSEELKKAVEDNDVFARMFPEAKLRAVNALVDNGEIVAMTGDGVNDAPALKAAHIGISMGKRGSEVARNAASVILMDDDLSHMTEAIALGRKIYDNLKKAIQYIVSIHVPIILVVILPLILGWRVGQIFTPVHVIFLELIMGPTCSIIYENEPLEPGTMARRPRPQSKTFMSGRQLGISILQGLMITAGCLGTGFYFMQSGERDATVRTAVFITLLFSNIFLTLVNRSFHQNLFTTLKYRNLLMPIVIAFTLLLILCCLYIPFFINLFGLHSVSAPEIVVFAAVGFLCTGWIELFKARKD